MPLPRPFLYVSLRQITGSMVFEIVQHMVYHRQCIFTEREICKPHPGTLLRAIHHQFLLKSHSDQSTCQTIYHRPPYRESSDSDRLYHTRQIAQDKTERGLLAAILPLRADLVLSIFTEAVPPIGSPTYACDAKHASKRMHTLQRVDKSKYTNLQPVVTADMICSCDVSHIIVQ